ncbi:MAG: AgmX/PglI C-terminal domain-containing protein [Kofleriaceae bacterium]
MKTAWLVGFVMIGTVGCSGTARGLDAYRTDTQALLDTRNPQLQTCYDEALKANAKLAGTVTVSFVVEKKSGAIASPMVDAAKSTAPAPLGDCVVKAIQGLQLTPGDRHEGRATFVYEFKPTVAGAT